MATGCPYKATTCGEGKTIAGKDPLPGQTGGLFGVEPDPKLLCGFRSRREKRVVPPAVSFVRLEGRTQPHRGNQLNGSFRRMGVGALPSLDSCCRSDTEELGKRKNKNK